MNKNNNNNSPLKNIRKLVLNIVIAFLIMGCVSMIINIFRIVLFVFKTGAIALLKILIPAVIFCCLIFVLIKWALAGNKWAKILLIIMAVLTVLSLICAMFFLKFMCDGMVGCCETARNLP